MLAADSLDQWGVNGSRTSKNAFALVKWKTKSICLIAPPLSTIARLSRICSRNVTATLNVNLQSTERSLYVGERCVRIILILARERK